jgi:hypothetical protein
VFPVVMVILMFGMFVATPRQMRWVSLYAVLLFGDDAAGWPRCATVQYPLGRVGHFLLVATMMPAVSLLAGRLATHAPARRRQRADLAQALAASASWPRATSSPA